MTEFGGRWGESWLSHRRVLNHVGVGEGVGVGQTLSTDWCHRSDPIVQAGGEAAERCGTEA